MCLSIHVSILYEIQAKMAYGLRSDLDHLVPALIFSMIAMFVSIKKYLKLYKENQLKIRKNKTLLSGMKLFQFNLRFIFAVQVVSHPVL